MKDRLANLAWIRSLDPERDYATIYKTMVRLEFPWDMRLAFNLAFNRTFSMPVVAEILAGTGELTERTQRRVDDTGILMYEIVLHGLDHPRGRAAIRRINQLHRAVRHVPPDEFRYVLACLAVVPLRWLDRYGWRRPCCHERAATVRFYRELGARMRIDGLPADLESWFDAYDRANLLPNPHAAAIERATRMLMLARIPRPLAPVGDALVAAFYDPALRAATGVPTPSWPVRAGLHLTLRTRALLLRHLGRPRREPLFADGIATRSYPDGYEISRLGPPTAPAGSPPGP